MDKLSPQQSELFNVKQSFNLLCFLIDCGCFSYFPSKGLRIQHVTHAELSHSETLHLIVLIVPGYVHGVSINWLIPVAAATIVLHSLTFWAFLVEI